MERLIEQERKAASGDSEREARVWAEKLKECARLRGGYQDQQAAGLMTLEELGAKLKGLEETRRIAERELAALGNSLRRSEELEADRDALLESYAEMVPAVLDELSGEERNRVYRMLRLEVKPSEAGFEVTGAFCTSERMSWHPFESAKTPEIAFRALLTQDGAQHLKLVRA